MEWWVRQARQAAQNAIDEMNDTFYRCQEHKDFVTPEAFEAEFSQHFEDLMSEWLDDAMKEYYANLEEKE